ncbi:hypothetical protein ACMZOO_19250 (plasmid) [Catenovulum sp. SX2]|uniref:hypothetical protein n=1 Tax=Catenovulum sp. SX2 TaxID=3398614 RepID=UPI003F840300
MFKYVILLLVCLTSGCATNNLAPHKVTQADLNDNNGILVGSFSRDPKGPVYYSQTFRFKNLENGSLHQITSQPTFNMFSGKTPDDFKTPTSNGGVFIFSLPAGKYSFYNFRLYQSNGYVNQNWSSKEPFSIPFEVKPNFVNYVGEIKLSPLSSKNFLGLEVHDGGVWIISDEEGRDLEYLVNKYPEIEFDKINKTVPSEKDIFTPFVILPSELKNQKK